MNSGKAFLKNIRISVAFLLFLTLIFLRLATAHSNTLGGVATQHPLASETAARILREGGNAIDAAVGTAFTLAVVEPYNSGLGGGGMALVLEGNPPKVHALDFRETAPSQATVNMFQAENIPEDASRLGPLSIATPGELAGLASMHERWGKLPWARLFLEAIEYAENGFAEDDSIKSRVLEKQNCLSRDYDSFKIYRQFFPENSASLANQGVDRPLPSGEGGRGEGPRQEEIPFTQNNLAATLKTIRDRGAREFYAGEIGKKIIENLRFKGSLLNHEDLANYHATERPPLSSDFSFGKMWGIPPPTSGGIGVLQGMNLLETLSKKKEVDLQKDWPLWLVGVFGQIFQQRNTQMGDPDFVKDMPIEKWLSKSEAKRKTDELLKYYKEMPRPSVLPSPSPPLSPSQGHTTQLSVIDAEGNAVSMTLTLNLSFGSCVTAGETGILMNDEMDDFTTQEGKPNAFALVQSSANSIAPGKRPLSSMSPTLVTKDKKIRLALGSPGGPRIITSVLEVLARHYLLGENLKNAIAAPRLHYQWEPFKVFLESNASQEWIEVLKKLEMPLEEEKPWGNIQAVSYDPKGKTFEALSDPRGIGKGIVVYPTTYFPNK